jgi:Ca-activated chloride channel homolog
MTFGEPYWLIALVLLPILLGLIWRNDRLSRTRLERLAAPRLLPELTELVGRRRRLFKRLLFLGALATFIFAMARPQSGYIEQEVTQRGRDIMLSIDTSKSMLTQDAVPDRLTRAKLASQDILNAMKGDRFGLIAFAGSAQVEAPLTLDYQTVIEALNDLNTNTVEKGGTDITAAIRSAEFAFGKSETSYRALVLLTDGEDLDEDSIAAANEAKARGIRIFTIGIGTNEGGLIPQGESKDQYVRDRNGQLVRSHLDEKKLSEIASATGAFYTHLDPDAVNHLVRDGLMQLDKTDIDEHSTRTPIERYRWPLATGLLLLFFSTILTEKRKDSLKKKEPVSAAIGILMLLGSLNLHANSALDLYDQGDFQGSLQKFREQLKNDPNSAELNIGAGNAAFQLKKYDDAFESYSKAMTSADSMLREHAYYNAGNALFLKGNNTEEIEEQLTRYYDARYQYHQALDLNPQDDQARKNLQLLEERIKQAEQRKQQEQLRNQQPRSKKKKKNKDRGQQNQQQNQPGQPGGDDQTGPPSNDGDDSKPDDPSDSSEPEMPEQQPTPKKEGQLQENTPPESGSKPDQQVAPPKEGKMSSDEAMGLLNSLRDEGQRLDLSKKKGDRRVTRDW